MHRLREKLALLLYYHAATINSSNQFSFVTCDKLKIDNICMLLLWLPIAIVQLLVNENLV